MDELIKVVLLGIVQGITEFLPISSTGHLIVGAAALNFAYSSSGTFEIFIQLGSVLAVVAFYRADLLRQVRTVRTDPTVQRLWLYIVVAAVPAAAIGFAARGFIKRTLYNADGTGVNPIGLVVIALALILGGVVFLVMERRRNTAPQAVDAAPPTADLTSITLRQAIGVGVAQTFALIPGVSRSGASIVGGLLGGMNRPTATAFSFYLSIPVLGGATVLDLLLSLDEITSGEAVLEAVLSLIIGAIAAGIVSWFAIGWLLRYVARNNFTVFGYYRIGAGVVILALTVLGVLA
ncbi:MAG: undecaprenyl-diphosphate phosphatase [Armatimonadetes bacterium]|nr:undecaprenyl-diphosphate phosphatase [Anaerolineae bacterium]